MDLVDLMIEKKFLGQEFLTWLWFKSEERGGTVAIPGSGDIIVVFEKHLLLEFGEGEYNERLVCTGLQSELREARTGLLMGKKLEQARLQLVKDSYEYNVTIAAGLFELRNIRLPKTAAAQQSGEHRDQELEGLILERLFLFEELYRLIDDLFRMYLMVRLGDDWQQELSSLNAWIKKAGASL